MYFRDVAGLRRALEIFSRYRSMSGAYMHLQKVKILRIDDIGDSLPEVQPARKITILGVTYDATGVDPSTWSTF